MLLTGTGHEEADWQQIVLSQALSLLFTCGEGKTRRKGQEGGSAVKHLPSECKEHSWDSQNPMQMPGGHGSQSVTLARRRRQRILRASWLARLAVSASSGFD